MPDSLPSATPTTPPALATTGTPIDHRPLQKKPRLWPAIAVLLVALAVGLACAMRYEEFDLRVRLLGIALGTAVLEWLWLLFASRLRWRVRLAWGLGSLLLVVIVAALVGSLFRVTGVRGDLTPILVRRGHEARPLGLPASPAQPSPRSDFALPKEREFPQFLGQERRALVEHVRLAPDWNAHPPRELWRQPIGAGWSSFAIAGNSAWTQELRQGTSGPEEVITCYDLLSGTLRWAHAQPGSFRDLISGDGPRATPTVAHGRLWAMSSLGQLTCLDAATGQPIWNRDVLSDARAQNTTYGKSCSPLLVDGRVIVSAGGPQGWSLVAYDANQGDVAWHGGNDPSAYSSPTLARLANVPQVLIFNADSVVSHDPQSGSVLWRFPWQTDDNNIAQPVAIDGQRVLVTTSHDNRLLHVEQGAAGKWNVRELWHKPVLKTRHTNVVIRDGFAYALDLGILACADLDTGQRRWKQGRYGHGQVLGVGEHLLVQAESGEVVLVQASPTAPRELARIDALHSKTWNNPAFAPPYLLVRNAEQAACYQLTLDELP